MNRPRPWSRILKWSDEVRRPHIQRLAPCPAQGEEADAASAGPEVRRRPFDDLSPDAWNPDPSLRTAALLAHGLGMADGLDWIDRHSIGRVASPAAGVEQALRLDDLLSETQVRAIMGV